MNENQSCCVGWRSPKTILALIAILVLGAVIIISILRERIVADPQYQISVAGQGKVVYDPDVARVNLEVEISKAAKPEDALNQLNDKMKKVIAAIEQTGIAKENIQTQNYTLIPQYDTIENISKVTGYNANQSIIIKVDNINKNSDKVSTVIAAAGNAGTNKINGVSFEASNINELKQVARLKAIADARLKAKNVGKALGVRLGKVVGWWENYVTPDYAVNYYDGKGGMGGGGGVSSPSVSAGDRELIMDVNVSYKIK